MEIVLGAILLLLAFSIEKIRTNKDAKSEWVFKIERRDDHKFGLLVEIGWYWVAIFVVFFNSFVG